MSSESRPALSLLIALLGAALILGCTPRRGTGGGGGSGDDDDAGVDDDDAGVDDDDGVDPQGNVEVRNETNYVFFELLVVDVNTGDIVVMCSPFEPDRSCWMNLDGQAGFVALTEPDRFENPEQCFMQTAVEEIDGGRQYEFVFSGTDLDCDGP